jgi:hypothetical protein
MVTYWILDGPHFQSGQDEFWVFNEGVGVRVVWNARSFEYAVSPCSVCYTNVHSCNL